MPFLSPVILFAIVTGMIYTFQYFTEAFVASGSASSIRPGSSHLLGYPGQSLLFYTTDLYQQGFVYFKTGYASAMAWLLFLVIFVCTVGHAAHVPVAGARQRVALMASRDQPAPARSRRRASGTAVRRTPGARWASPSTRSPSPCRLGVPAAAGRLLAHRAA